MPKSKDASLCKIGEVFQEISKLPDWMQIIILEDISCAIENRIRTMELIIRSQQTTAKN